jgi:hypothetical protein
LVLSAASDASELKGEAPKKGEATYVVRSSESIGEVPGEFFTLKEKRQPMFAPTVAYTSLDRAKEFMEWGLRNYGGYWTITEKETGKVLDMASATRRGTVVEKINDGHF